ncbi:MAG: NAD(P)H-hydrate dehydratase [Gammaproteobacteria bacterium]|nr:NAD(P)H-hydrate dehydratase [Gammaproteobacteria bacterium]
MSAQLTPQPLVFDRYRALLSPRKRDSHKGDFGHVLIIGGHPGFSGAVRLAGEAALRTGAGSVSIATHPAHAAFIQTTRPELMCHGIEHHQALPALLKRASVIVIGPGLSTTPWGRALLETTLSVKTTPIVFDADALNLLPTMHYQGEPHHLYTPHPGEAARLLGCSTQHIQADRMQALLELTQTYPGITILKGMHTLIGQQPIVPSICHAGNPGMSTAGMGDVLTGIIAGLIAQHIPLMESACLGVLIHALAADCAASKGERGLIASDVILEIRNLVNASCTP